jgi:hypothetical protein
MAITGSTRTDDTPLRRQLRHQRQWTSWRPAQTLKPAGLDDPPRAAAGPDSKLRLSSGKAASLAGSGAQRQGSDGQGPEVGAAPRGF